MSERTHHSSQGETNARAGEWGERAAHTATIRNTPTPQPELFDLSFEEEPGGARPDRLLEVRPQERVQRHTVEQIILAPMLDVPVPLMEEQLLVDAFAPHDIQVSEQVIEVPKILIDELSVRTPVCEPQLAEQLVEAPSIVSLIEVIRQPVEQNVDIPVPHGESLQGLLPGHGSTASSSSSHVPTGAVDEPFQGFFRTFPQRKKCEDPPRPGVGTGRGLQLMASMSLAGLGAVVMALTPARWSTGSRHGCGSSLVAE